MSKIEIKEIALIAFEESDLSQTKANWDIFREAFFAGYVSQQKEIRIKMDQAIGIVDKLITTLS